MATTTVPYKITPTTVAMNTITNNNLSTYIANTSVVNSVSFLGKYQNTAVGYELTIRTIVPTGISADPYRKAMVAFLFFRRIFSLSSSPSITISDLTATVAANLPMPIGLAEREAERTVSSVPHAFFDVGNLKGIGFLDSSGKSIMVSDNHAANITFFSFRSTVLASAIDQRFSSTTLSLDFLLRLSQIIMSTASAPARVLVSNIPTPPSTSDHTMVQTPTSCSTSAFVLNNVTDDVLNSMDTT